MPKSERESIPPTTMYVRGAIEGDPQSLDWIIERLSPLLLVQAEYRLGPALRTQVDPQDLVNEAWVIALPRMGELSARDGRITPVLLKFLTTTMIRRIGKLLARRVRPVQLPDLEDSCRQTAESTGVPTRIGRNELQSTVWSCLQDLRPNDREIIILRGVEQHRAKAVADMLNVTPEAVDQRYSRALKRLRGQLPESVFDDLVA